MREKFISAYMYDYGVTRAEAAEAYRNCTRDGKHGYIEAIIDGYEAECKKAFYED